MRRVAIVGADFAPSSLPPALRIRLFARHLPEFGWEPTIIATQPQYYDWPVDPENERLLPDTVHVIRTPALPARLTGRIGFRDVGMRSLAHHWRVLSELCRRRQVELVLIPVPPYVPMVLGRLAHRLYGVPYVIDYIDPWVTDYYWKVPKSQRPPRWPVADAMSRILEPFAVKHVSHIVGVSRGTTESVIARYPHLTAAHATEIPYGGEPEDFEYLRRHPRRNPVFDPSDGLLHVSYVGALIPPMHATVRALFAAVRCGIQRSADRFCRLRLHFVGGAYAPSGARAHPVLALAEEAGIADLVEEHPARVPYLDALQILLDSHALLIVGSDAPHYTASKVFPYILARRPLLALFHEESSVATILRETGAGEVLTYSAERPPTLLVEEISRRLEALLTLPGDHQPATRWDVFDQYTARAMTGRLAQALQSALAGRRAAL